MIARTLTTAAAVALALVLPAGAPPDAHAARTAAVSVPVDRANPGAGRLSLYVRRVRAPGRARGTILYLTGGPGASATSELGAILSQLGPKLRRTRDVVAFDARGTGRSGAFVCPELQRDPVMRSTQAAIACARQLGAKRSTTPVGEQVEDVEAVRRALGIRRLDLLAVSFGTEVALRYAQRHPGHVGRIVLDSVLPPEGPSPVGLEIFTGMPEALREVCTRDRCPPGMPDVVEGLAALVPRLRTEPLRAPVFDRRGRSRDAVLDPVAVLDVLLAGDFSPALRLAVPGAVAAAGRGDAAPLLRLLELDRAAQPEPQSREFSVGQYAATSCEGLDFPWDPAADMATRRRQAAAHLAAMGDGPFRPFDGQTVLDADFLALCVGWPAPGRPPAAVPREIPGLPMLLLAGEEDLRTPATSARAVAARNPRARLLTVPGVGHGVMSSDVTGCAERAAQAFLLRARTPRSCRGPGPFLPPVPIPPARIEDLGPVDSPVRHARRTVAAVDATLDDVVVALNAGPLRGGGLRGGSYSLAGAGAGLRLRAYEYVPGVRLDGDLRGATVRIAVSGPAAAQGTLRLSGTRRFEGTLGGVRVSGRLAGGPPRLR